METKQKVSLILVVVGIAGYFGYRYYQSKNAESDAKDFPKKWMDTLCKRNSDHIADLYSGDGVLIGTVAETMATGKSEIEYYFRKFVDKMPCGTITDSSVIVNGDIAIVNGNYTISLVEEDGDMTDNPSRFTFILQRESDGWKILTHHSSFNPILEPMDMGIYGQEEEDVTIEDLQAQLYEGKQLNV